MLDIEPSAGLLIHSEIYRKIRTPISRHVVSLGIQSRSLISSEIIHYSSYSSSTDKRKALEEDRRFREWLNCEQELICDEKLKFPTYPDIQPSVTEADIMNNPGVRKFFEDVAIGTTIRFHWDNNNMKKMKQGETYLDLLLFNKPETQNILESCAAIEFKKPCGFAKPLENSDALLGYTRKAIGRLIQSHTKSSMPLSRILKE
eukprot:TRINITY_DN435_c0_g1_i1.p1 TRINITY_DN435_c0_g1~~TRINITY_DN435_c0_g1_i1.p1  ORF type:complete len:203 (+),score=14.39 TRINITY_DN435_c0_g1_i1:134-742(+)